MKDRQYQEQWMRYALKLARKAEGLTSPNPTVGAVLVKDGKAIAGGYHKRAGAPHAEIAALKKAGRKARGCDLFVTLEPCCHHGRTPPCVDAVLESGVKRVIVGTRDPNPRVAGRGIRKLRASGIEVFTGVLKEDCRKQIEFFSKFITAKRPFVILKSAVSLDGKIATANGESKWITGELARKRVHQVRARVDAILVGANTVLKDDPRLTGRPSPRHECYPVRVVMDPQLRVPSSARIFENAPSERVVVVTQPDSNPRRKASLLKREIDVIEIKERSGSIPFGPLLKELAKRDVLSLLVEGGGDTASRILKEGLVDRVMWFIAPILIGGKDSPTAVEGEGIQKLKNAWRLKKMNVEQLGNDLLIEGDL